MRYLLVLLGLLASGTAQAIDCRENPDCALMGYSTQTDPNCLENGYIACPFDTAYKKCVNYKCEAWGFTQSDKTSWCAEVATCPTDKNFTLCQKACIATKYEELKDLASSGTCKLITMKNDITIPQNQGITLAENTVIDGGSHTLSSSGNQGFDVYKLNNNTGFKNIFIKHEQDQTQQNLRVFSQIEAHYKSTFQDVQIEVYSEDTQDHKTSLFNDGAYEISGKFTAGIQAKWHYTLSSASLTFKNADINITTTGTSSDAFYANADFINSLGTIKTDGVSIVLAPEIIFSNSQIHLIAPQIFCHSQLEYGTILLKDNAEVTLTFTDLTLAAVTAKDFIAHIKFESSASVPATLIIEGNGKLGSGDVTANNTANMLVLNGVTYHPKQAGTTKLSEIPTSTNWISENP